MSAARPAGSRPERALPPRPLPPRVLLERTGPAAAPLHPVEVMNADATGATAPSRSAVVRVGPARPDSRPMRMLLGLTGLAALSAIATAIVSPPATTDAGTTVSQAPAQVVPAPSIKHQVRYIQLKPGQTAPPNAAVKAAPKPTPRVVVVTTTRQSGKP